MGKTLENPADSLVEMGVHFFDITQNTHMYMCTHFWITLLPDCDDPKQNVFQCPLSLI